jgi:hypothetical protein
MFETLKSRLKGILAALTGEDAKIASELLESAETEQDINYVLSESGIGEIPSELRKPKLTIKASRTREPKQAPRTGSEAKQRRTFEPKSSSIIVVRKSGRQRKAG